MTCCLKILDIFPYSDGTITVKEVDNVFKQLGESRESAQQFMFAGRFFFVFGKNKQRIIETR